MLNVLNLYEKFTVTNTTPFFDCHHSPLPTLFSKLSISLSSSTEIAFHVKELPVLY